MIIIQNLPLSLHWLPLNPAKIVIKKTFLAKLRIMLWEMIAILSILSSARTLAASINKSAIV